LIRRGDEIWHYTNEGGAHGGDKRRTWYRYKQRLDGFTSLDATSIGKATTLPLVFKGRQLVLNMAAKGSIRVGIVTASGGSIPGFSLADCKPVKSDGIRQLVSWNRGGDVSSLSGKAVKLVFELNDAKLYALQFVE